MTTKSGPMTLKEKFCSPKWWGRFLAFITMAVSGFYLLDFSTSQIFGLIFLFSAARVAIDTDNDADAGKLRRDEHAD